MKKYSYLFFITVATIAVMAGCKKSDSLSIPEAQAHFTHKASGNYSIATPTTTYKVPIGVTNVSDQSRTITVSVSSPTGAVLGTHYTLSSTSVVIPAGQTIDSIEVKGVYNQYTSGRKDTLIFAIQEPTGLSSNDTFRLAMRGPCFEGDVNLDDLLGDYKNTIEDFGGAYGPYTTKITAVNKTSATTGTITVANIYDNGWNPITFNLDWTDPNSRRVTLVQQSGIGNAGTLNSAYSGMDISVRNHANGTIGTFSICNQMITIKMQLGVTGLGWFGTMYTVNMAR